MKKVLCSILLLFAGIVAFGQPHLRVSSISGHPFEQGDTAFEALVYDSIVISVHNDGTTTFSDLLTIFIQDSPNALDTLYSDSNTTTILPGDSVSLFRSGYFFSVTHFDDGDNIIVVWPQAITTPVLVDTLQQQIHFVSLLAGIDNSDRESLILYPNPASKFISFNIPDGLIIKQVRIYDAEGREIYQSSFIKNYISINEWPAGIYLIEVEKADGNKQTLKLLKE